MANRARRILFVVNDLGYFVSHRLAIALAAKLEGYEVFVVYGVMGTAEEGILNSNGLVLRRLPFARGGMNPISDLKFMISLFFYFKLTRPDIIHLITIKPVLYGGIAARLCRVPSVVSAVAGLGFVFVERGGVFASLLRGVVINLLSLSLGHPHQKVIVQNPDDRNRLVALARIPLSKTKLIPGSGVDLTAYPFLPETDGTPIVAMAARLLRDKGVLEFVAAARLLRERGVIARFWLIGDVDLANPASVTVRELSTWKTEGLVECLGHRFDVADLYAQAKIVALPSYYAEGLPKALIEAAACGRAIVTTDMPGCRDAIEPGVTGLLVPMRDAVALADALEQLIRDSSLRRAMGKAGRAFAEREFAIEKVVASHLKIYRQLLEPAF